MKKLLKKLISLLVFFLIFSFLYGNTKQSSQMIQSGHWVYDSLTYLASESKTTMFLESQPLSISEIRYYLNYIDYEELSPTGKKVYDNVLDFIKDEDDFIKADGFRFYLNGRINTEFYVKSNPEINWSFRKYIKDNAYTIPIILGFSDYFTIETDLFVGKCYGSAKDPYNFTNMPIFNKDYELDFPDFAYFSGAKAFENWGVSAHMGKTGMKIGQTNFDSILYSNKFKTDFYSELSFYSNYMKIRMNVNQITHDKYLYLHHLTLRPFKFLNIGVLEGSLVNSGFEIRFLNPLMIMHQLGGWGQYIGNPSRNPATKEDYSLYGEGRFCAYLGFTFEFLPVRNLRIYGLYAQNEILDFAGDRSPRALSVPDSLGAQLGVEYFIPLANQSYLKTALEAIYTSPYLYVKHSPDWSLYRDAAFGNFSWIGSPFGPDNFSIQAKATYESNKKWSVGTGLMFSIHGENTPENLFTENHKVHVPVYLKDENGNDVLIDNKKVKVDEYWYWDFYPSVEFGKANGDKDKETEAVIKGRNMWMTGTPEYKGQVSLNGHYRILNNLDLSGQFIYTFIFNHKNIMNKFSQGVEFSLGVTYELF